MRQRKDILLSDVRIVGRYSGGDSELIYTALDAGDAPANQKFGNRQGYMSIVAENPDLTGLMYKLYNDGVGFPSSAELVYPKTKT